MNLGHTLRGLLRHWVILLVGLLVAAAAAAGAWRAVPPTYTRSSTQILLPGSGMIPSGSNPYMFVGGLAPAADIVVRGLSSKNVVDQVVEGRPSTTVEVTRDPTTSGPVILITVESRSDRDAAAALAALDQRTASLLDTLQAEENIPERQRISVVTVSVDRHGTAGQRERMMVTAAVGVAIIGLTVLVAGVVEGIGLRPRRGRRTVGTDSQSEEPPDDPVTRDGGPPSARSASSPVDAAPEDGTPQEWAADDRAPEDEDMLDDGGGRGDRAPIW
ncbi:hypothetical protein [Acidipropionibacterium acidipropionici]|uniref:hypothetical protein n=1 Tax=Acidipropionibacterium acidipropionici TaxID=1748 RepID=UPI00110A1EBE|nr:hypothetical protein [Acidipropionibacterium acidipropionici]QCV94900.1 hypothetical protein FEZ30_06150 [Acidipropionibacterium acidipropionici]